MAYIPAPSEQDDSAGSGAGFRTSLGPGLFVLVLLTFALAFVLAPWSFEEKAHALLHGVCGQTESHTLAFDGMLLPLDTRCVGIFGGMFCTMLLLIGAGRHRAAGLPSIGAGVLLIAFLGAMALDGINSLMTDLGKPRLYVPTNDLRLLTGWLTGIGLGSILIMVTGMTFWRRPRTQMRVLPSWWWPLALAVPCLPVWLLLQTDAGAVFYSISVALIASALVAFGALAACAIVMLRNRDNTYERWDQLAPLATAGFAIALVILLGLAGGRFWIESTLGLPTPS
ncbi:MAG: DUF2085 domain-containing protein [Thermomicrobiales bacterium]